MTQGLVCRNLTGHHSGAKGKGRGARFNFGAVILEGEKSWRKKAEKGVEREGI